jgi:hypothetical protein
MVEIALHGATGNPGAHARLRRLLTPISYLNPHSWSLQ